MINSQKTEQITTLSKLIQDAKFSHYLDFSRKTGISELTLHRIDCGLIDQIPLKYIKTIARELNLSLEDFFKPHRREILGYIYYADFHKWR